LLTLAAVAFAGLGPLNCGTPPTGSGACTKLTQVAAKTGDQCGVCYGGALSFAPGAKTGNGYFYCSDVDTSCYLASGGTYPTCNPITPVTRGQPCQGAGEFCTDGRYTIECLSTNGVCGGAAILDPGMACPPTGDKFVDYLPSPQNGCSLNQCVNGQCNVSTSGDCSGAPTDAGHYCNYRVNPPAITTRVPIGGDCTNDTSSCVWNAACVSNYATPTPKFTCTAYGSGTVGAACVELVCTGDLACVPNSNGHQVCTTVTAAGLPCTAFASGQCDSTSFTSVCECDYTTGAGLCVATNPGTAITNAWVNFVNCVQNNGCTLESEPFYGGCVDQKCSSQYHSFLCAKGVPTVHALHGTHISAPLLCGGGGSPASTTALAVAALAASLLAMLFA